MFWVIWVTFAFSLSLFFSPFCHILRLRERLWSFSAFTCFILSLVIYGCFFFPPLVSFNLPFVPWKRRAVVLRFALCSPGSSTLWPCIIEHTAARARSAAHNTPGHWVTNFTLPSMAPDRFQTGRGEKGESKSCSPERSSRGKIAINWQEVPQQGQRRETLPSQIDLSIRWSSPNGSRPTFRRHWCGVQWAYPCQLHLMDNDYIPTCLDQRADPLQKNPSFEDLHVGNKASGILVDAPNGFQIQQHSTSHFSWFALIHGSK